MTIVLTPGAACPGSLILRPCRNPIGYKPDMVACTTGRFYRRTLERLCSWQEACQHAAADAVLPKAKQPDALVALADVVGYLLHHALRRSTAVSFACATARAAMADMARLNPQSNWVRIAHFIATYGCLPQANGPVEHGLATRLPHWHTPLSTNLALWGRC